MTRTVWIFIALLTLPLVARAEPVEVRTGKVDVTFHISHPAKEFDSFLAPDGGSGTIRMDPKAIENTTAEFSIKVDHFDSQNTRRDSHMVEVMEALVYPTIDWNVTSVSGASGPWTPGVHRFDATGPISIHGVTRQLTVPVEVTVGGKGEITFGSQFSVMLEDFGIERPTLVFVPIENEVPIIVKVTTKSNPALLAAASAPEPSVALPAAGEPEPGEGPEAEEPGAPEDASSAPAVDASVETE